MAFGLQLDNSKFAYVASYEGRVNLNIRHFFAKKTGEVVPTAKGVTLTKEQLQILIDSAPLLLSQFEEHEARLPAPAPQE